MTFMLRGEYCVYPARLSSFIDLLKMYYYCMKLLPEPFRNIISITRINLSVQVLSIESCTEWTESAEEIQVFQADRKAYAHT